MASVASVGVAVQRRALCECVVYSRAPESDAFAINASSRQINACNSKKAARSSGLRYASCQFCLARRAARFSTLRHLCELPAVVVNGHKPANGRASARDSSALQSLSPGRRPPRDVAARATDR